MRIGFAGFEAEVPEGWRDESTIIYTMPGEASDPTLRSPANVVLTWEPAHDASASEYLEARLRNVARTLGDFRLLQRGDHGTAAAPLPYAEYNLAKKLPLTQILLAKRLGDRILCVTGTAAQEHYPKLREQFVATAQAATLGGVP